MRILPEGIFPPPNNKRTIITPHFNNQLIQQERGDVLQQFEREPYKMMVKKELAKSDTLKAQTKNISFITNLTNIKHGIKCDYSDAQLMDLLFKNLNFTDALIEEHLSTVK